MPQHTKFSTISPGQTLGLIAVSSAAHPAALSRGIAELARRGFAVKQPFDGSAGYGHTTHLFSAESAKVRADALGSLFADPEVAAIIAIRGAYGSMEILPELDFQQIAKHPKPLVGFSDVTALLLAVNRRCGFPTFHGPTVLSAFGGEQPRLEAIQSADNLIQVLGGKLKELFSTRSVSHSMGPASVEGRIVAGNLSVIQGLIGTAWEPDFNGAILCFEEVGERPYRLHRMLLQLKQAGKFDKLAGVLVGELHNCSHEQDKGPPLEHLLSDIFDSTGLPLWRADWFGHGDRNEVLPIGCAVRLSGSSIELVDQPF